MEIGFSLGTNLGDRVANLAEAKRRLLDFPGTRLAAQSRAYETQPVDVHEKYADLLFLNSVLIVESDASCETWLQRLGAIESAMGRIRGVDRNAPRTIDIDILYAGDRLIDSGGLTVPHPRWAARRFVVEPLAEVRPDLVIPGAGKPVSDVLAELPVGEGVQPLDDAW